MSPMEQKRAARWHFPHGSVWCFSKAAKNPKKTPTKIKKALPIITSKRIDSEMQRTDYSHTPQLLQGSRQTRAALQGYCRDLGNRLNPRGLAKHHRLFSLVPVRAKESGKMTH